MKYLLNKILVYCPLHKKAVPPKGGTAKKKFLQGLAFAYSSWSSVTAPAR